jgi:hypothetical protein
VQLAHDAMVMAHGPRCATAQDAVAAGHAAGKTDEFIPATIIGDHAGMAESLCNKTFFFDCQRVLKHDGIMVINLWGGTSDELFQQSVLWLGQAFDWRILLLPVVGRGNIIGLAFNEGVPMASLKALRERALTLEDLYNIEFTTFLKEINVRLNLTNRINASYSLFLFKNK